MSQQSEQDQPASKDVPPLYGKESPACRAQLEARLAEEKERGDRLRDAYKDLAEMASSEENLREQVACLKEDALGADKEIQRLRKSLKTAGMDWAAQAQEIKRLKEDALQAPGASVAVDKEVQRLEDVLATERATNKGLVEQNKKLVGENRRLAADLQRAMDFTGRRIMDQMVADLEARCTALAKDNQRLQAAALADAMERGRHSPVVQAVGGLHPAEEDPHFTAHILDQAKALVTGERAQDYGPPADSFGGIARAWCAYLRVPDYYIDARDVAQMMVVFKAQRDRHKRKRDNLADQAGYAQCASWVGDPRAEAKVAFDVDVDEEDPGAPTTQWRVQAEQVNEEVSDAGGEGS